MKEIEGLKTYIAILEKDLATAKPNYNFEASRQNVIHYFIIILIII